MFTTTTRRCLARRSTPTSKQLTATRQFQSGIRLAQTHDEKDTAFSPNETKPEEQKERIAEEMGDQGYSAAKEGQTPANSEQSSARPAQEGGRQGSANESGSGGDRSGPSGGGSPPKAGGGKSGG